MPAGTLTIDIHIPINVLPQPHPVTPPCEETASHCPPLPCLPAPCPPVMPDLCALPAPQPTPCIPVDCPPPGNSMPPMPSLPYCPPPHPSYPPHNPHEMNRRYQLADRLLDMANRLLFNDQGIPLNQTFGSPFGSSYVAGSPSPYPSYTMGSNATSPFHPPMNDSTGYPPPGMPGLGSYPSSSSSQFPHSTISGPFGGPSQQLDFNNPWSRLPGSYSPPPGNGYGNGSGNPISDWMSRWFYPGWTKNARQNTLYPPITNTADLLNRTSVFPTLQSLLNRSGLTSTLANLESQGPVIVFAPTEQAFRRLQQRDPQLFQRLTDPRNSSVLMEILKYHVSQATRQGFRFPANNVAVDSLTSKDDIQFSGNAFQGRIQNGNQLVTTGRALKLPNNTLIVPIDDVLIPPSFDMSQLKQST